MTEIEPIDDIVQGWPGWAAWTVREWASKREGFRVFLRDNAAKIRRKFAAAKSPDDKGDVLAELELASCVVADPRFNICYEPYDPADGRGPDFFVRAAGLQDFHLEVKRIRETEGTREIQRFKNAIIEAARAIPSSLGMSICIFSDSPIDLGRRLRAATSAAVAQCQQAIHDFENSLPPEEERVVPIDGFEEEEVSIRIIKVRRKDSTLPTANFGGVSPVAYTQKESHKFGDHVLGCLGQLRPGTANVLAVKIDSTPHDPEDLIQALHQLAQQVVAGQDEFFRHKGFAGSEDFSNRLMVLSAVVVKSIWSSDGGLIPRNVVWRNPRAAVSLEDGVVEHLRSM
jgi:hypothetical protein